MLLLSPARTIEPAEQICEWRWRYQDEQGALTSVRSTLGRYLTSWKITPIGLKGRIVWPWYYPART